jgi:hypothetical protein
MIQILHTRQFIRRGDKLRLRVRTLKGSQLNPAFCTADANGLRLSGRRPRHFSAHTAHDITILFLSGLAANYEIAIENNNRYNQCTVTNYESATGKTGVDSSHPPVTTKAHQLARAHVAQVAEARRGLHQKLRLCIALQ